MIYNYNDYNYKSYTVFIHKSYIVIITKVCIYNKIYEVKLSSHKN